VRGKENKAGRKKKKKEKKKGRGRKRGGHGLGRWRKQGGGGLRGKKRRGATKNRGKGTIKGARQGPPVTLRDSPGALTRETPWGSPRGRTLQIEITPG